MKVGIAITYSILVSAILGVSQETKQLAFTYLLIQHGEKKKKKTKCKTARGRERPIHKLSECIVDLRYPYISGRWCIYYRISLSLSKLLEETIISLTHCKHESEGP
jgi:hypothetical protein